jgi:hypothetical protein
MTAVASSNSSAYSGAARLTSTPEEGAVGVAHPFAAATLAANVITKRGRAAVIFT